MGLIWMLWLCQAWVRITWPRMAVRVRARNEYIMIEKTLEKSYVQKGLSGHEYIVQKKVWYGTYNRNYGAGQEMNAWRMKLLFGI